jgi:glucose/arabinose dehydrogenase
MKLTRQFAATLFLALVLMSARAAAQGGTPLTLQPVLSNLSSPVLVTNARDGSNRLFVVEQPGRIRSLQPGATTPTVFLDITAKVLAGGERGLLGLAFHPQFHANRRLFVNYTRQPDGATVIAEYRVSETNPNLVDAATERILLVIPQPYANHNGGMIAFGQDGFLYIGMGDGGSSNDPQNRAQNVEELLGKMLRINVDEAGGSLPYSSPPDNPFFGTTPGRDEIYAVGLRNPFRFSFDRVTGQLYAGDVGQGVREEIDIITRGGNYGWRVFEGTRCTNLDPAQCNAANYQAPVAEYDHTGGRCSVTGGYVYRGTRATVPSGAYIYADFCTGEMFLLQGTAASLLQDTTLNISSFGEDEAGELYVVGLGGTVHRLVNSCTYSISPASRTSPAGGETLTVNVTTQGGCGWSAVNNSSFITVASGASGTGSGTVTLSIPSNGSGVPRIGTVFIAGQVLTITQPEVIPQAPTLQFSQAAYEASEGAGRAVAVVTRAGDPGFTVSFKFETVDDPAAVSCATANGTAYARCDYATTVDTVTFAPGETSKEVSVSLVDDAHVEGNETVQLRLRDVTGMAVAGAQSTATLTITDNDTTAGANPIFSTPFFVRQHYLDFLAREPEANEPWSAVLNNCSNVNNNPLCDRITVSQSFFGSPEFRLTGFFVYNFYRVALDRRPDYAEIIPDMRSVKGQTASDTYARRAAFPVAFVQRPEFRAAYDSLSNTAYVNALLDRHGLQQITTPDPQNPEGANKVTLTRAELINRLGATGAQGLTRAQVLRAVVESDEVAAREYNGAFVAMQYYGYLRRTPEETGYQDWLRVINQDPNNVRVMVNGFMNSTEYRLRFGQP